MSKQLFDALSNGELEMVLKQLNTGIDINTRGNLGETPLITAARLGHKQIVNYLLQKGADPEIKDFDGITALFLAIRNRNTAIIYEIAKHLQNQTSLDDGFFYSIAVGYLPITKTLIDCGANINAINANTGRTCVMDAISCKNYEMLEFFLQQAVGCNMPNKYGCTPLMLAVLLHDSNAMSTLIKTGANVHAKDVEGRTALDLAKNYQDKKILILLKNAS